MLWYRFYGVHQHLISLKITVVNVMTSFHFIDIRSEVLKLELKKFQYFEIPFHFLAIEIYHQYI